LTPPLRLYQTSTNSYEKTIPTGRRPDGSAKKKKKFFLSEHTSREEGAFAKGKQPCAPSRLLRYWHFRHMTEKGGKLALKQRYERSASIAPFYTGGPLCISRDGSRLACKCGGEVKLLDAATGAIVATIAADAEDITALALSPSGQELITAGRDMMVKTWDLLTQKKVRSWKSGNGNSFVQHLAYDDTGTLVAGGCSDAIVRVWDAERGFATHSLSGHNQLITSLAFGPTPRFDPNKIMLFSGAEDGEVRVWALASKTCRAVLKGHDSAVTTMALHMATKTLVTGGRDRVLSVWDLDTYARVHSVPIYDAIEGLAIVQAVATGTEEEDVIMAKKRKRGIGAQGEGARQTGVSELNRADLEVVTAGANGQLKRWRVGSGKCVASEPERAGTVGYMALLHGFLEDEACVQVRLVAVTIEQTLLFFRPDTLEIERMMVGYNDEVLDVSFASTEPPVLAVSTNSDHLRLFDTTTQSCRLLYGHTVCVCVCVRACVFVCACVGTINTAYPDASMPWKQEVIDM
jgi:U3 small nucleolar RNA-associated protein 13